MKKKIMAVLLLLTLSLCSCGPIHQEDSSSEPLHITIYIRDDSIAEVDSSNDSSDNDSETNSSEAATTTTTKSVEQTTETFKEFEAAQCVVTTVSIAAVTQAPEVEVTKEPEYIVFKPSTHYIHRSTCRWCDNSCQKITDTKDIQARLCTECNPDIEVVNPYVIVTTAPKKTELKQTTTTTTSVTTFEVSEEVEVSNTYRLPYILSDSDWNDICKVVCNETGYCGEKQQKAVANTIFNRIIWASKYGNYNPYPADVYHIVRQKNQYNAIYQYRNDARLNPGGSLWNQTMRYIKEAASEPDFTNGAIGYYNPAMSGYLSAFENNRALLLAYVDDVGRFFKLNPACYTQK